MMRSSLLFVILALGVFQPIVRADQTRDDLQRALDRLDEGTALLEAHDPQSAPALDEAAAMLVDVIETHSIHTPGIYHALGNAYMLRNDLGHAVLAYRQGEQLDPTDPRLRDSLEHARSLVPIRVEPDTTNKVWSTLLLWRGYVPRTGLWYSFVTLFTLGWFAWSARVLGFGSRKLRTVGTWFIIGSVIPAGMLGSEWAWFQGSAAAVITDGHVIARSGPDDTIYDPVFADALQPGIEARILETRDGWNRLALADGSQCWVPATSVEKVNP